MPVAPASALLPRGGLHLAVRLDDVAEGWLVCLVQHVLCPQEPLQVRALLVDERRLRVAVPDADGRLRGLEGEHDPADVAAVPVEGLRDDLAHDAPPEVDAALPGDGDRPPAAAEVRGVLPEGLDALAEELDAGLLGQDRKVAEDVEVTPELGEAPDSPDVAHGAGAGRAAAAAGRDDGHGDRLGPEWLLCPIIIILVIIIIVIILSILGEVRLGGAGGRGGLVDPPDPGAGEEEVGVG